MDSIHRDVIITNAALLLGLMFHVLAIIAGLLGEGIWEFFAFQPLALYVWGVASLRS